MKYIKFSVKEEEFTFLKTVIGLDNMEEMFRPVIISEMEKYYGKNKHQ